MASLRKSLGVAADRVAPDHGAQVGNLGAAQGGLALADVLERAAAGQVVAVVEVADGADAVVLRTTEALAGGPGGPASRPASARWPTWWPRAGPTCPMPSSCRGGECSTVSRPGAPIPSGPTPRPSRRSEGWKFGFNASRCQVCGFLHLPPTRVCLSCQSVDQMEPERMADLRGTVATYTVDRLAFSLSPPMVGAVIDFDGGGRYRGEMTDVDPDAVGRRDPGGDDLPAPVHAPRVCTITSGRLGR